MALINQQDLAKDSLSEPARSGFSAVALIYLAKSAEEVPALLDKAVAVGGQLVKPTTQTPYGVAGYFKCPDGHLFEIDY